MAKPTPQQVQALLVFGILPPPTKASCTNLLSFVFEGRWRGWNKDQRIANVVLSQRKWVGKKVVVEKKDRGTVDHITALSPFEITGDEGPDNSPFRAHIVLEGGKKLGLRSFILLELIEES